MEPLNKIYEEATQRESAMASKYFNKINKFDSINKTQDSIESELLDIIVFSKWCIERLRKI
jgi:hypothetical protein